MRKLPVVAVTLLILGLTACTNEQIYDSLGDWRRSACNDSTAGDRARCLAEANKPYSQYDQERKTATKAK